MNNQEPVKRFKSLITGKPLQLFTNIGNNVFIDILDFGKEQEAVSEFENELAKLFKGYEILVTVGIITTELIIKSVDFLDLTKEGFLKKLHNLVEKTNKENRVNVAVSINDQFTNVGGNDEKGSNQ